MAKQRELLRTHIQKLFNLPSAGIQMEPLLGREDLMRQHGVFYFLVIRVIISSGDNPAIAPDITDATRGVDTSLFPLALS